MATPCLYNQRVTSSRPFQRNCLGMFRPTHSYGTNQSKAALDLITVSRLLSQADKNSGAFVLRRIRRLSQLITTRFHIGKKRSSFSAILHSSISFTLLILGKSTPLHYSTTRTTECYIIFLHFTMKRLT
jgi:hypothetical protein